MQSFVLSKYLDFEEAAELKIRLDAVGIAATAKRYGLPRFFGGFINYMVTVQKSDKEKARIIESEFLEECRKNREETRMQLRSTCPSCGESTVEAITVMPFFQRIFFAGVERFKCTSCNAQWFT